ncbi:hypothetical protein PACTADRAFT_50244 [Pachysolen tannophilus NRRL Y-2460]|uniref:Cell division control protein 50 n=1 Tax=Pachysolen tannophilus NRRL Y-2460 TaxID=669874 RepID=A0A1E4TUS5_PACTA|nr:hypothetical protein PACTADRAFT_50244 [Pachysolen tannophilus NRRL Y-2460]
MNFLRRRRNSSDSDLTPTGVSGVSNIQKSRKPPNTAFRQQRLKAYQIILTPKTVLPLLIVLAVILIPLGVALLYTTYKVQHLTIDYSACDSLEVSDSYSTIPSKYIGHHFKNSTALSNINASWKLTNETTDSGYNLTCNIEFDLPNDLKPPIYLYYKLTNFYQNHREYVKSYDLNQLKGDAVTESNLDSECKPLKTLNDKIIYPCGLVANSVFNDSISSSALQSSSGDSSDYIFTDKDIAWSSDRKLFQKTTYTASQIVPPPNWMKKYPDGYTDDNIPDISEDEFFQNWMRTAALPSFMKLAFKNTTATLSSGTYILEIELNYPVTIFGGTKSFVLTTNSIVGGRNLSLGVCYIVVGGLCLVFFIGFLFKQLIKPRKIGDHTSLMNIENENSNNIAFGDNQFFIHTASGVTSTSTSTSHHHNNNNPEASAINDRRDLL